MPSTASGSAVWRFKQVYVEIPPSPFHTTSSRRPITSANHKENTPLRSSVTNRPDPQTNKRKNSSPAPQKQTSKKPRIDNSSTETVQGFSAHDNALINCHQCKAKHDPSAILQCTFTVYKNASKPANTRRCSAKYCRNCLKKYSEDLDRIVATTSGRKANGHADASYVFKCPRCRGLCSCWVCKSKATKIANSAQPANAKQLNLAHGSAACIQKPAALPDVTWSSVPAQLSLKDYEDRILIREFVVRFSNLRGMSISKAQLEELDFVGGTHEPDGDTQGVYVEWVSEVCVKSLVLSLIGVLAAEEDSSATLVIQNAMKDIRHAGANLTRMWAVLSSLREILGRPEKKLQSERPNEEGSDGESSEDRIIIEYPDPSPPPAAHNVRGTRSTASTDILIVHTAQLIPVILGLTQTVLESHAIRVELEEGAKEGRERFRESRERIKLDNESWDALRKDLEGAKEPDLIKIKTERQAHKSRILALENAAKVVAPAFAHRFSNLGTDSDGRTYWALSPGVHDREYALDCIAPRSTNASRSMKSRNRRRSQMLDEDRKVLKDWTKFLAVHGKEPPSGKVADQPRDVVTDQPQWWGFWDPSEIRRLAEWLSITHGVSNSKPSSGSSIKTLVKNINEYATTLEWIAKGEDDEE
ncbi:hypothetical protein D9757_004268 [Collybiopsis confluens]|uniref:Zinc-finger domain-containing protein n=1 Tax=Collybiopsis confluens TaxID=2823264 RepID=A0A8H5HUB5_9AGAR|nr:hypothetical protein D9757_004268 [Collybiopsis confluens]